MWKQETDFWAANDSAGLILAGRVRNFSSQDSFRKNWQNGLNDLIAFSSNLHERFPMCAVLAVMAFPRWAATEADLEKVHNICRRTLPRERPLNSYGKFEGFALVTYDESKKLVWPFPPDSPLAPAAAFATVAGIIYARTISLL